MNQQTIEAILNELISGFSEENIVLNKSNEDGRLNSALNEPEVFSTIKKVFIKKGFSDEFTISKSKAREWYDFAIEDKEKHLFIPVNIKVTELGTDNLNCKLGLYYALTGLLPSLNNIVPWEQFFSELKRNINTYKDKDYYFFVVDKNNPKTPFWNSLKQLQKVEPNGNNLPFQANWKNNKNRVHRTHEEAGYFLLNELYKSVKLRASIKESFDKNILSELNKYKESLGGDIHA